MDIAATEYGTNEKILLDCIIKGICILDTKTGALTDAKGKTIGSKDRKGYLLLSKLVDGKQYVSTVARLIYLIEIGNIPKNHYVVKKDNELGWGYENLTLMSPNERARIAAHNRIVKGKRKISDETVSAWRKQLVEDKSFPTAKTAEEYGISKAYIYQILTGMAYKHLPGAIDSKLLEGSHRQDTIYYKSNAKSKSTVKPDYKERHRKNYEQERAEARGIIKKISKPTAPKVEPVTNIIPYPVVHRGNLGEDTPPVNRWRTIGNKMKDRGEL